MGRIGSVVLPAQGRIYEPLQIRCSNPAVGGDSPALLAPDSNPHNFHPRRPPEVFPAHHRINLPPLRSLSNRGKKAVPARKGCRVNKRLPFPSPAMTKQVLGLQFPERIACRASPPKVGNLSWRTNYTSRHALGQPFKAWS